MNWKAILSQVPDYQKFLTVAEMDVNTDKLVAEYPDIVNVTVVGNSKNGHPIKLLKIGSGSKRALIFGCPHPNEPIGAMMLEFLTRFVAENKDFRTEMDYTWYFIKSVDPDGTMLNEGWFKGPFTIYNYARNYFRPNSYNQVEWTFPVKYKKYSFNSPIPETKALMKVIEEAKPDFMYSLHNSGFGGAYWYTSKEAEELYENLRQGAIYNKLPLNLGEPEMPYAHTFSPAVFRMPSLNDQYDYFESVAKMDPVIALKAGASSIAYAERLNSEVFGLLCEVPYFYNQSIEDLSESDMIRRDAILKSCDYLEEIVSFMASTYEKIKELITNDNPFKDSVEGFILSQANGVMAKRKWALSNPDTARKATVAEVFDNLHVARFYRMLFLGILVRVAEYQLANLPTTYTDIDKTALTEAMQTSETRLKSLAGELEKALDYTAIPIASLVKSQLASALITAQYLNKK